MIELKNLCAGYHGADVLRGVSMSFEPGRVTVLVGANGCGKSTLLKAAIGMIKRSSGEVYIDSRPLDTLTRREVALRAAYMPQDRSVPSISVRRLALHGRFPHLSYPRRYTKADYAAAEEALMLSFSTPSPTSSGAVSGFPPISPQTLRGFPSFPKAFAAAAISRSRPGWVG